ncbi:hypothetical protein [Magnetococcus sp. PR-3]|uniref:hypothetical protein n=1 Tax=Magnetococcus sp. PR-3 TaxID=3120355 RepID=UPI002FCDFBB7
MPTLPISRRSLLQRSAHTLAAWGLLTPLLSACMKTGLIKPGLHQGAGGITANGKPLKQGEPIPAGALLETDLGTEAVVVIGKDALLLRADTRLLLDAPLSHRQNTSLSAKSQPELPPEGEPELPPEGEPELPPEGEPTDLLGITGFDLQSGGVLSVFATGPRLLRTPQAHIAIRGTGIYLELEPKRTYACTCYGEADLMPLGNPEMQKRVKTRHHDDPRYIDMKGDNMMVKAPVVNHTDAELIMLEALVLRKPPFLDRFGKIISGTSSY